MNDPSPPIRAIRMAQPKDMLHTFILGSGFVSSVFLPMYLLQFLSKFPAEIQNRVIEHQHWIELGFVVLGAWLAMIALRFATHLEIRQRNSSRHYSGPLELVLVAGTAYVIYKHLSDSMIENIKGFWSPEPSAMSLNQLFQLWIVWWSILLGYIAKVPWDRAKQLIQEPSSKGNGEAPLIAGPWSLLYSILITCVLIAEIVYSMAFPAADPAIARATSIQRIANQNCISAGRELKALAADGRVTEEERDVAITIISNARAIYGLQKCPFNPKALR